MDLAFNITIGVTYFLIAVACIPILLHLPVPGWIKNSLAFTASVLFFPGCGLHHFDMAIHAATNTPVDTDELHMLIFDGMQAVGAPIFAALSIISLNRYMKVSAVAHNKRSVVEAQAKDSDA